MKLKNQRIILQKATKNLSDIEISYRDHLNKKVLISEDFMDDIGTFLNSLKKALDYSAYYIFETYCVENYDLTDKIDTIKRNIYFPIRDKKDRFDEYINSHFKGLKLSNPELVNVFEREQTFSGRSPWLDHLTKLNNDNKHRDFTPQERVITQNKFVIGNNVFHHLHSSGNGLGDFSINGKVINLDEDQLPLNSHPNLKVTAWVEFVYKDLNIPVLPALKGMLINTIRVIDELENKL